ncbi:hypothetical protein HPP92_014051 [Vanilla planifolia]|uniref:Uncharacterized protein n=1 Tax=Vanilla planifolia TaxID=51239 RepID=A0A835QJA5_VANPL|nr:hypothetical protein HPP92_014491 [Vanilla planifolia]KAG0474365.1 hypothetical protein HPP92_014051 [Vanilla planifolia]
MASTCFRSANRTSLSLLRSHMSKAKTASWSSPLANSFVSGSARAATGADAGSSCRSSFRRFRFFSRSPSELGCCGDSMYPLHSAVALARLNSRLSLTSSSCRDLSQEVGLSVPR